MMIFGGLWWLLVIFHDKIWKFIMIIIMMYRDWSWQVTIQLGEVVKWAPNETSSLRRVCGSSRRNFLASEVTNGAFQCHFGSLYSNTPPPSKKKFSSDLHWSQEWSCEMEKVWNQTKVWKFWALSMLTSFFFFWSLEKSRGRKWPD